MKSLKKKIFFFLLIIFSFAILFIFSSKLINNTTGIAQKIKYFVPQSVRDILRETVFKSKYLEINYSKLNSKYEKVFENDISIATKKLKEISNLNISSDKNKKFILKKFSYPYYDHFSWGKKPPGYVANYKNHLILMSGSGEIIYFKKNEINNNSINFNILKTNFQKFINIEKYYDKSVYGIRDITVINDELFVSFVDPKSCEKLSILRGKLNFNFINFEKFFSFSGCKNDFNGQDNEGLDNKETITFIGQRSGGRIVKYDEENILFTIGDYSLTLYPPEAQNLKSFYGSLIKINLNSKKTAILAKGLRNPQGLYYDIYNNVILLTDHGPDGGDELNIFDLNNEDFNNYGWPISSYGKHYSSTIERAKSSGELKLLNKGAPLNKSHIDYDFKEPLKYWSPSIGISEVIKIPDSYNKEFINDYLVAAMGGVIMEGDMTLHQIRLSKEFDKIIYEDKIIIEERIRDLYYDKDLIVFILLLGTSPSLGILRVKNNK